MKILIIHNHYLERGGEDEVVNQEKNMLESAGHEVVLYERSNEEITQLSFFQKILFVLKSAVWSKESYLSLKKVVQEFKPDVAHVHNTFLVLSSSIYDACLEENVPVVQSIHNFRFLCANGLFFRDGRVCEDCVRKGKFSAVFHRCWRNSFILSWLINCIVKNMRKTEVFTEKIKAFVVSAQFCRTKLIDAGFPQEKIYVKPHFVPADMEHQNAFEDYAIFVGRLIDYKGVRMLVETFKEIPGFRLKIVGDGPLFDELNSEIANIDNIELVGRLPYEAMLQELKNAAFLIFPSKCYETFGRVIVEAYACGVPVIVSKGGSAEELVDERKTGVLFEQNNSADLVEKIKYFIENRELLQEMRENALKLYREKYCMDVNCRQLLEIYQNVLDGSSTDQKEGNA